MGSWSLDLNLLRVHPAAACCANRVATTRCGDAGPSCNHLAFSSSSLYLISCMQGDVVVVIIVVVVVELWKASVGTEHRVTILSTHPSRSNTFSRSNRQPVWWTRDWGDSCKAETCFLFLNSISRRTTARAQSRALCQGLGTRGLLPSLSCLF